MNGKFRFKMIKILLIITVFEAVAFMFIDVKATFALLPVLILLIVYALQLAQGKNRELPLLPNLEGAPRKILWKEVVNALHIGIAIVDENNRVIWRNTVAKGLTEFFQSLNIKEDLKQLLSSQEPKTIKIDDKIYSLGVKQLKKSSKVMQKELSLVYFNDITELEEIKNKLNDERAVVCYVQVDNFTEIIGVCPEENRPELFAKIDKIITQWFQNMNGFVKKLDKDKYIALLQYKELKKAEDTKFDILEQVKKIKVGPAISVTLSIGASYVDKNMLECHKLAQSALELCLGRGGDQAVVKDLGKTYFYGGKTKEVEKYSRVRARVISQALKNLIEESDMVLALGHVFLDMDALGAGVGVFCAAKALGKRCHIILSQEQNPSIESLMKILVKDDILKSAFIKESEALEKITKKTLLVVVDTHRPSLCLSRKILDKSERVVVIDHHRRSEEFIDKAHLVYLEPYASSTSEMVTEILEYIDEVKITPTMATALLSGIVVDTRNFSFKTGVRTFEAASFLRKMGADPTTVYKLFQEDLDTVSARADVIKRAEEIFPHIAMSYYLEKPKNPTLAAAQAANSLLEIKGVYASFVLVPVDNGISVSARSLGDINVQRILEKLGGGGHLAVAGAQLEGIELKEAIEKLKNAILEYIGEDGET